MHVVNQKVATTAAVEVSGDQQLGLLQRYLGYHAERIEGEIYGLMRRISPTYQQGAWRVYELSSGSFYLAPRVEWLSIHVERTTFGGALSGDAVGIVVSLLGLRSAYRLYGNEDVCTAFLRLRDFAKDHAEGEAILAATD